MSLASDYAAIQSAADATKAAADEGVPDPFAGASGHAEVTEAGNMRVTPSPGQNNIEIPATEALAFATWIVDTFGEQ